MGLSRPRRTWVLRWFTRFQRLRHRRSCWRGGKSPAPSTCKAGCPLAALTAVTTSLVSAVGEGFSAALANSGLFTERGPISITLESLRGLPATGLPLLPLRGAAPYRKLA